MFFFPRFGSPWFGSPGPLVPWSSGSWCFGPLVLVPWSSGPLASWLQWLLGFSAAVASRLLGFGGFLASLLGFGGSLASQDLNNFISRMATCI